MGLTSPPVARALYVCWQQAAHAISGVVRHPCCCRRPWRRVAVLEALQPRAELDICTRTSHTWARVAKQLVVSGAHIDCL